MAIKRLLQQESSSITSSSSIFSPLSVVKELIDNSMDALRTAKQPQIFIEVDYPTGGLQHIMVRDNGSGVPKEDRSLMCLNCTTSKLSNLKELDDGIETCGFRGEALFFISQLSGSVEIISKCANDTIGEKWKVNDRGLPCSVAEKVASAVGTVITVKQLFHSLPVRKNMMKKNARKSTSSISDLIAAYSIIHRDIRFQLRFVKVSPNGQVSSEGPDQIYLNKIPSVKVLCKLLKLKSTSKFFTLNETINIEGSASFDVNVEVILPRMRAQDESLPKKNFKILSVNNRSLNTSLSLGKSITKLLNEVYSLNGFLSPPSWVVLITVPLNKVDVNIEPEKSDVLISEIDEVLLKLKDRLAGTVSGAHGLAKATKDVDMIEFKENIDSSVNEDLLKTTGSFNLLSEAPGYKDPENAPLVDGAEILPIGMESSDLSADNYLINELSTRVDLHRKKVIHHLRNGREDSDDEVIASLEQNKETVLPTAGTIRGKSLQSKGISDDVQGLIDLASLRDEEPIVPVTTSSKGPQPSSTLTRLKGSRLSTVASLPGDDNGDDWSYSMIEAGPGTSEVPDKSNLVNDDCPQEADSSILKDITISNPWTISKMASQTREARGGQSEKDSGLLTPETTLLEPRNSTIFPKNVSVSHGTSNLKRKATKVVAVSCQPPKDTAIQRELPFATITRLSTFSEKTHNKVVSTDLDIHYDSVKRQRVVMFEQEWISRKNNPSEVLLTGLFELEKKYGIGDVTDIKDIRVLKTAGGWFKLS